MSHADDDGDRWALPGAYGSADNNVYALDGATGMKKWFFATGNGVLSSPAIGAEGTVYFGSFDNNVYAIRQ